MEYVQSMVNVFYNYLPKAIGLGFLTKTATKISLLLPILCYCACHYVRSYHVITTFEFRYFPISKAIYTMISGDTSTPARSKQVKNYEERNTLQVLIYMQCVSSRRRVLKGVSHVKCNTAHISSKVQFKEKRGGFSN